MTEKLTITQLAEKVNDELKNNTSSDARHSSELSERRIRDYITKGILDKPFGQGRDKWYAQSHVDKLLAVRQLQSDGLTDTSIKKLSSQSASDDSVLRNDALGFLSNIGASASVGAQLFPAKASGFSATSQALNTYYTSTEDTKKVQAMSVVQKQVSKVWNEYQLDDEGKVFLRVEGSAKVKNGEEILKQLKSILNIGDKND